jgi:predicted Zn-dependent protease
MIEKRNSEKWNYKIISRVIEAIIIIAMIYGGIKVTLAGLCIDVDTLKCKTEEMALKINTLETKFEYIKETLTRIERKINK